MTSKELLVLIFISLCIGAGGYIYNDIKDIATDTSNKKRMIVGYKTSYRLAYTFYWFMVLTPLLAVYSLAQGADHPEIFWGYILLTAILLGYNIWFKRLPLIGNIIVAALCAFAVLLVPLLEWQGLYTLSKEAPSSYTKVSQLITAFTIFSFVGNLNREIIKDIEDIEGDRSTAFKTLPLVTSVSFAKGMTIAFSVLLIIMIGIFIYFHSSDSGLFMYMAYALLLVPLLFLIFATNSAKEKNDFSWVSFYWKIYFLIGFISLVLLS